LISDKEINMQAKLSSFVEGADHSLFPLYNLPYGIFKTKEDNAKPRVGVAIGAYVLDLAALEQAGLLNVASTQILFNQPTLNLFAVQGYAVWSATRKRLQTLLSKDNLELQKNSTLLAKALIPQADVTLLLPFKISAFSDFYACEQHAANVGKLFRSKENPLLPNWKYLPVAYNGRASTVFLSGTNIKRPMGQIKLPHAEQPIFSPSKKLDFELELGIFIGVGNPHGQPISIHQAKQHIFGVTLLNDWSARDIQAFEYQPLGPFLSKSFATSISPWVVTLDALADFIQTLPQQHPPVVDYLKHTVTQPNIQLKTEIQAKGSANRSLVNTTKSTELYWSMEQMLAHHTINNCIMQTGDLLGTGTISGPRQENWGSLLEITFNGSQALKLADGQERTFLQDGDTVIMSGFCANNDYQIGFGSLEGTVLPA
jgi:fumarylacetoacetase